MSSAHITPFRPVSLRHAANDVRPTVRIGGRRRSALDTVAVAGVRTSDVRCVLMSGGDADCSTLKN